MNGPKSRKVVAIHQPNFFPWLGYFDKIARAGVFLVMDNVQFPRTGAGTWINRVRLIVGGYPRWVTMPIVRAHHGLRRIDEMRINNTTPWRAKLLKTVQMNYGRAPCFDAVFPFLTKLVENPTDDLVEYNLSAIRSLATALQIDTSKFTLGSSLGVGEKSGTDLLISMVKAVGGTAYLCGSGAVAYQQDDRFETEGLELIYQNFQHPTYVQANTQEFVPGLSVIDALMNCGFEKTGALLRPEGGR